MAGKILEFVLFERLELTYCTTDQVPQMSARSCLRQPVNGVDRYSLP
jgi:hypothetical protein